MRQLLGLVAVSVLAAVAVDLAACTTSTSGMALPADTLGAAPSSAGTTPAPKTAPVAVLDQLLLSPEQISVFLGDIPVAVQQSRTWMSDNPNDIRDPACRSTANVGELSLYADSGWVATRGNDLLSEDERAAAAQGVTSFADPADAVALLGRAREQWKACANRGFTFEPSASHWNTDELIDVGDRLTMNMHDRDFPDWNCHHTIAVRESLVAEARVCLPDPTTSPAANAIVDQLLRTIPR